MSFMETQAIVPAYANLESCDILVVTDCKSTQCHPSKLLDVREEGVFDAGLHMAGMLKSEIKLVALFPTTTKLDGFWINHKQSKKRNFTGTGQAVVDKAIARFIEGVNPKVIVTMGPVATHAFLGRSDYTDIRGYPFPWRDRIVIPTNHPKDMMYGNYEWRYYFAYDFKRAKKFAEGEFKICEPNLVIPQTFDEAIAILSSIARNGSKVSVDIEVNNYEVSCIGFACSEDSAVSIPTDHRWNEIEETQIWQGIASILGHPSITKVGQNLVFDLYFLLYKMGILTRGPIIDTMIGNHIMYPDFLKGLGFLGSIYTTMTYWKDAVDFKNIKGEA
jgi:hypothetical protein